ncbi:aldolase [Chloroflexota bacterium]
MPFSQFLTVGRDLFAGGLVVSNSGNMSVRIKDTVWVTRRGSRMGCLHEQDIIETGLCKNSRTTPLASSELSVHRAIYQKTRALAVVHAHPPHSTALSMTEQEIIPNSANGPDVLGKVPVIGWGMETKEGMLADEIAEALKEHRVVMVHGHGSFAVGQLLEEAYNYTATLEECSKVLCLLKSLKV